MLMLDYRFWIMFLFVIPTVTWESVELLEMKYKKRKSTQGNLYVSINR